MASSSVSQDDHDVEHDFAIASRRAKVRSARANRAVNSLSCRGLGEELERGGDDGDYHSHSHSSSHPHQHIPRYEQQALTSVVLVESNDASPKPIIRGVNKDKRPIPRGAHPSHGSKSNKGIRDRRKLREKRRSTAIGVMHLPSTESTGGSTGEDENEENSSPPNIPPISKQAAVVAQLQLAAAAAAAASAAATPTTTSTSTSEPQATTSGSNSNSTASEPVKVMSQIHNKGKSESDLDADDEAAQDSSEVKIHGKDDTILLKLENQRLKEIVDSKDRRISMLEMQVAQLTKQVDDIKDKLLNAVKTSMEKI